MRTTHFSSSISKRNYILGTNEVCPLLRTNFDYQLNEGFKWFFRETRTLISCIRMRTTLFSSYVTKRNYILTINQVHSRYKDQLWFPSKYRVQMVFFWKTNASISWIPMETTHFHSFVVIKKLNSCHKRVHSRYKHGHWFATKWRVQIVFSRNQSLNIMYPNGTYVFLFVRREKKLDSYHKRSSFLV